ncbi:MAG: porin, partial [Melioribacteraceae bacterium]|nr:porin [Melioribacteraceae bacterium]
ANFDWNDTEGKVPQTAFSMRTVRLLVSGNIIKSVGYHVMVNFWAFNEYKPELMQAWVSYNTGKYAKFRVGQFKYPFGIEAYPAIIKWKFINPSSVTLGIAGKLGTEGSIFRDIGAQVEGSASISSKVGFLYKFMVMNGNGANVGEINNPKDIVLNAGFKLPYNIILAGSYFNGTAGENADVDENAYTFNASVKEKKFTVQAEYMSANYKMPDSVVKPSGYYLSGTFMITNSIEAGFRYDFYNRDSNIDQSEITRYTFSAGYYFNKINRILINYEIFDDQKNPNQGNLLSVQFQAAI